MAKAISLWRLTLVMVFIMLPVTVATAQKSNKRILTGTVTDACTNEPLIGVTIQAKNGDGNGVITDINGNYTIKVSKSTQLVFSYIGYKPQTKLVGDLAELNVQLLGDDETLNEVVVVGAGTQKKVSLTGSITSIQGKALQAPSSSLTSNLAGKFAGIISMTRSGEAGATSEFYIRGVGTFGGRTQPLILLDGIEISSGDLNNLPAENIASFTLLTKVSHP